jgi:hypothetical protein
MPTSRVHQSLEAKYNDTSFLLESIDGEDLEENSDAYSILSSPVGPDGLGRHLGVYSTTLLMSVTPVSFYLSLLFSRSHHFHSQTPGRPPAVSCS